MADGHSRTPDDAERWERAVDVARPPGTRYVVGVLTLGIATVVYLGLLAVLDRDLVAESGLSAVFAIAPVFAAVAVTMRATPAEQHRFRRHVAAPYVAGLVVAVALDAFLLDHGTVPAALVGLLAAIPCGVDAVRVARSSGTP